MRLSNARHHLFRKKNYIVGDDEDKHGNESFLIDLNTAFFRVSHLVMHYLLMAIDLMNLTLNFHYHHNDKILFFGH